jgi:hypothetical protein
MRRTRNGRRRDYSGYEPLTGAYHRQHDWDGPERLSQTVSEVVLALSGLEPNAGPPLSDAIDPDALNRLFGPSGGDGTRDHLTFTHQNCTVVVYRDGHVVAYLPELTSPTLDEPPRHPR